jgi:regulator of protease activity HflC (stomatin/prohibitin superfamily)
MDFSQGLQFLLYGIVALFLIGTILSGFFQVQTAEAAVIQRMGKFNRVATAGINFKLPWLDQIAGRIDLRVQQLALDVETKTKDNVFVKIPVSVQYHALFQTKFMRLSISWRIPSSKFRLMCLM